jgi:hypothetical protein
MTGSVSCSLGCKALLFQYSPLNLLALYQVVRNDPKDFRQRRPDGNGGWIWNLDGVRRVPYRLSEVLQYPDATVFFCEGEKDADRVASLGHCATTVASGKWSDDCVKALAGRDIIILQDNDDAGAKKALAAARAVGVDAKTGEAIFAPHILWEDNHVDVTAAEAMATAKSPAARDEAKKFLTDTLANGPVLKAEIEDAADANGISERTLFRAKVSLALWRGRMARTEPGLGGFRRGPRRRLPRRRGATERVAALAALAALREYPYVKVLIHIYIWQGCQDCQTLSLAALPSIWRTLPCGSARLGIPTDES